uniref:C-type lectin domain-containing protein n=1 Tax=Caenorhabditis tropicalis TaxID=1561998 RepID=A0A1I7TX59_9PELO
MFFQTTAILLLIYSQFTLSDNSNPCDSTWIYYNKTGCCYKTSTEIGTWFDGSGICARMHTGSHLASLRSADESTFVTKSHRIGLDRIHAWTGLSQTQKTNNWTFTDGSKPWSSFIFPYLLPHNHSSCVELRDDWLLELFNHTGKTQPTFCYLLQKSLCKYCPIPKINQTTPTTTKTPALRIEKTHPRSNQSKFCEDKFQFIGPT